MLTLPSLWLNLIKSCKYSLQWQEPLNHSPSFSFQLPRRGGQLFHNMCVIQYTHADKNNHNLDEQWTAHNSLVLQLPRRADFFWPVLFLYEATQRQNNHNMKNTEQLTIHWSFDCPAGPIFSHTIHAPTELLHRGRFPGQPDTLNLVAWVTLCLGIRWHNAKGLVHKAVGRRCARLSPNSRYCPPLPANNFY